MRAFLLLLVVGALMASDDPLEPSGLLDYLGRPQPLGRKSLSLAQASGGGQVTAPVTPSVGQRAGAAREAATGLLPAAGLDPIGLSRAGLQFAEEALRLFPPDTSPTATAPQPASTVAPDVPLAEGQPTQFNVGSSGVQGGPGLTPAEAATAAEAEGGSAAASTGANVAGTATQALPYLSTALQLAQDIMSSKSDQEKGLDAAIDAAGLILSPFTAGISAAAAPLVKADVGRVGRDVGLFGSPGDTKRFLSQDVNPGAIPLSIAGDLVSTFGGPDFLSSVFGSGSPSRYEAVRKAASQGGAQAEGALGGVYAQATDPASLYSALGSRAGDRGSVRSYLNLPAEAATQLGLPEGGVQWAQLSPKQFMDVLRWFKDDPSRLSAVGGSGDVGYLPGDQAQALAGQTAEAARSAISRIIASGLPEPAAPVTMPAAPSAAPGPEGSLGFAKDLLPSE